MTPGYAEFSRDPSPDGRGQAMIEREMIHDMDEDGEPAGEDDILNPGF